MQSPFSLQSPEFLELTNIEKPVSGKNSGSEHYCLGLGLGSGMQRGAVCSGWLRGLAAFVVEGCRQSFTTQVGEPFTTEFLQVSPSVLSFSEMLTFEVAFCRTSLCHVPGTRL